MKLKAKLRESYDITINDKKIGRFMINSQWEGMIKLVSPQGSIIAAPESKLQKLMGEEEDMTIISISSNLVPKDEE